MARKTVKFDIGDDVYCHGEIPGKVTAIHIRGKSTSYEFSYLNDGEPKSVNAEEVELEPLVEGKLGFRRLDQV